MVLALERTTRIERSRNAVVKVRQPIGVVSPSGEVVHLSEAFQRAGAIPTAIDLGTAVRTSLSGGRAKRSMIAEGVVIEIVPAGSWIESPRVEAPRLMRRSVVVRYVVQCWDRRLCRRATELVVIAL